LDSAQALTTWIKAAPTFRGLLQAIKEPQQRSWLGDLPPKLELLKNKPTVFIDSLRLRKTADHKLPNEDWFDGQTLELNPDLVAVIGKKGSGKSALADIFALLGDTTNTVSFSFLTNDRFRDRKNNRSQHFEAELTWANGLASVQCLADDPAPGSIERVRYIPQLYFERVCAGQSEDDIAEFTGQIERVIFTHVPAELRGEATDLKALLSEQETEANRRLERLRTEIRQFNSDIRDLQVRSSQGVIDELYSELALRKQQLADLQKAKPPVPAVGDVATDANTVRLLELASQRNEVASQIEVAKKEITQLLGRYQASLRVATGLRNLQTHVNDELERLQPDAVSAGIPLSEIARFELDDAAILAVQSELKGLIDEQRKAIKDEADTSLVSKLGVLDAQVQQVRSLLDAKQLEVQTGRENLAKWEASVRALAGPSDISTTIAYLELQIATVNEAPIHVAAKRQQREAKVREIAEELLSIKRAREDLVAKARATIDAVIPKHPSFSLGFVNELVVHNLENRFFELIKQVSGTFRGEDEGRRVFREFVESKELGTVDAILALALGLEQALVHEDRDGEVIDHELDVLVRKGRTPEDVLNFLYSLDYLRPQFSLAQAGQPLTQLSPGQRGALLLIFYLLVDESDLPIVLDQPEENLDNETVYSLLVPAIKQAKMKRQIIMVTHNANLAVCCDAEQIVHVSADRSQRNRMIYQSGPIEELSINSLVVDVLEGTHPAFDNRRAKYAMPV